METGHYLQETELIQGLQAGQGQAFEWLVTQYKDRLYNTILGFLQNEEDAEDATQEVFIKVHQSIKQFKGEAALSTWLYRIAVSHSLDMLRKKKRQKKGGLLVFLFQREDEWIQPDFHHPGVATEQKETAAVLFKAVRQLPEQQQTAFLLQKMENLNQGEIAEIMKTSVGAVESLLQRAKANLRKLLEAYYQKHYK
jgi:RNA polymerase sigma-70 factor (ECF subfamily)